MTKVFTDFILIYYYPKQLLINFEEIKAFNCINLNLFKIKNKNNKDTRIFYSTKYKII